MKGLTVMSPKRHAVFTVPRDKLSVNQTGHVRDEAGHAAMMEG